MPEIDRNPYNFVEFDPAGPMIPERDDKNVHGKGTNGRYSGKIKLSITTCTPLFIPKGGAGDKSFFTCEDSDQVKRYAIPGSSVKGPVRALFEILTLSRAGITSKDLDNSVKKLMGQTGSYASREPTQQNLATADLAEAVFGFIGQNDQKGNSKSLRGRVEFSTFFGPCISQELAKESITVMPLTSPKKEAKAKCLPLYYKIQNDEKRPPLDITRNQHDLVLRGRKMYWHQLHSDMDTLIPHEHDYCWMRAKGMIHRPLNTTVTIQPLGINITFKGEVRFIDLDEVELGALLCSLSPSLLFTSSGTQGTNKRTYGLKFGKGKPRGLGSVTQVISVSTQPSYNELYANFMPNYQRLDDNASEPDKPIEPDKFIKAYKTRIVEFEKSRRMPYLTYEEIPFVKDLEKLLRFPTKDSYRKYPNLYRQRASGRMRNSIEPMDLARNLEP